MAQTKYLAAIEKVLHLPDGKADRIAHSLIMVGIHRTRFPVWSRWIVTFVASAMILRSLSS